MAGASFDDAWYCKHPECGGHHPPHEKCPRTCTSPEAPRVEEYARCSECGGRHTALVRMTDPPCRYCLKCGGEFFVLERPTRIEDPGAARATT